ncbi:flavin-containing monooxygenase [Rhodococcus sp. O3]|uniref:flavin-containing monooxygenase n=1 Tax=Rhodococcus sp. O3 TaxID=3404919 RepID=UPI003B6776D8
MTTEHVETVIIGAGQAGLSTGYHLRRRGRPFLILDASDHIGDHWRNQWDTLRLYTPTKYDSLPGLRFPGGSWTFPGKDDVAAYLNSYAETFELPVRMRTRVERLSASDDGYVLDCGDRRITAENVVVATGTFGRTPKLPDFAVDLDPSIRQLHSSEYRRPAQLRPGPVLVVGASHSGTDIAYEVAATHPTTLCGRDCGQLPVRPESPGFRVVFPALVFVAKHVLTRRTPIGRKAMPEIRFHGGPMIRVKRQDLRDRGVTRVLDRVVGVRDGLPLLADGTVVDVTNVVWCTGFRQVFDWIDLPVFGDDGWPKEMRGVVADAPGLYFCGLSFQYGFGSMVLPGVGYDAEFLARTICARRAEAASQPAAA